jgi:hypothetical protein
MHAEVAIGAPLFGYLDELVDIYAATPSYSMQLFSIETLNNEASRQP